MGIFERLLILDDKTRDVFIEVPDIEEPDPSPEEVRAEVLGYCSWRERELRGINNPVSDGRSGEPTPSDPILADLD